MPKTPEYCPNCGAPVPARARACPECGADEGTGWSEAAIEDPLGLDQEDFNYEEFAEREFGDSRPSVKPPEVKWLWWGVALVLALLFLGAAALLALG